MRRETKNEIIITVIVALLIVIAALFGFSSTNNTTNNGLTIQTYNYNMSEVYSMNTTVTTVTNNGISTLDILISSDLDNHFSSTSKNNNQLNASIINPP